MTEGSSGSVVGHDSQRVTEDATDDKIGILSHEGAHAAGQLGQGDSVGQCLPDDVTTPQKAPNKANLESKQNLESQELKSETAGAEGRKQSQSSEGETRTKPGSPDGRPARQSGPRPVGREAQGSELLRAAGVPPLGHSDDLDSPGEGQMKSRTYRVTLADLTQSSEFRTKEDLQWAAQCIAIEFRATWGSRSRATCENRRNGRRTRLVVRSSPVRLFPQGSGPRVMVGVRNLMIDKCSFSGKTSLAAGNRHGHAPRESGGTRVITQARKIITNG